MAIVAAADEAYAMPLAVMLSSALLRLPKEVVPEVHVFGAGLHDGTQDRLARLVPKWHRRAELVIHRQTGNIFREVCTERHPQSSLLRLLIPDVIPEYHERAIYLDSDIVVERDVSCLWNLPMQDVPLYAVEDFAIYHYPEVVDRIEDLRCREGVEPPFHYLNSGVLLMNLPMWRREALAEQMLQRLRAQKPGGMPCPDQDAMNVVLSGRWRRLDPFWNFQLIANPQADASKLPPHWHGVMNEPKVIHYTMWKPWSGYSLAQFFPNFVRAYRASRWDSAPISAYKQVSLLQRRLRSALARRLRRGVLRT